MSDVRILARVQIREVVGERTYHAALPNGKVIFAYVQPRDHLPAYAVGDEASVLLSLCNFSEGRLVRDDISEAELRRPIQDERRHKTKD